MELLVQESLLVRQHGMGTFINSKGVEKRYRAITSITEGIAGQGLRPEFRVLSSGAEPAEGENAAFLTLERMRRSIAIATSCPPMAARSPWSTPAST
ncbi:hypothetical protein [Rhizobium rhizosphaerae]|uniref:hypothetical protein n=1 Tax=Xaviernesmea rhizosphaerae TaxID=1672749 RepID=UPI001FD9AA92|nr:hypothetical protein [Xaviernesmea rhizosphaerae]